MSDHNEKNNKKPPKDPMVLLQVKVPQSLYNEINKEANDKGISISEEARYILKHFPVPLTPSLMYQLENAKNKKYEDLKPNMPQEALDVYEEVARLWNILK